MALKALKCLHYLPKAPARGVDGVGKFLNLPNHMCPTTVGAFILPS
jgi:hypothetical protein